jgi:hypothetical protein
MLDVVEIIHIVLSTNVHTASRVCAWRNKNHAHNYVHEFCRIKGICMKYAASSIYNYVHDFRRVKGICLTQ